MCTTASFSISCSCTQLRVVHITGVRTKVCAHVYALSMHSGTLPLPHVWTHHRHMTHATRSATPSLHACMHVHCMSGQNQHDTFVASCRILAPSVYIFFASVIPALAFGEQLDEETKGVFNGVHVLLATAIAGVTQAVVGGQPLLIIGVAGVLMSHYVLLLAMCIGCVRRSWQVSLTCPVGLALRCQLLGSALYRGVRLLGCGRCASASVQPALRAPSALFPVSFFVCELYSQLGRHVPILQLRELYFQCCAEPIVLVYGFMFKFCENQGFVEAFVPWCTWTLIWTALLLFLLSALGALPTPL